MIKSLQCVLLITSVLSVSLFGGKNLGLTKEIDNLREGVVCSVEASSMVNTEETEEESRITIGYTDGFWVEEDETVYLLESYENRVLEIKRSEVREIPLAETVLPADIVCAEDNMYIYDDILSELQVYTKQGELLLCSEITVEDDYVRRLVKTAEGAAVQTYGGKLVTVDLQTGEQTVTDGKPVPEIDAGGYDFTEYIGTDEEGTVYAVYTKLVTGCSVLSGELTVQAVSAEGEYLGSYVLPVAEYLYLPGTYLQVQNNGNLYLLIPGETAVEVRKIALKESAETNMVSITEQAKQLESDYASDTRYRKRMGTACTATITLTRAEVRKRAQAMAEYQWTLKRTHTLTSKAEGGVTLPREIAAMKEEHKEESSWSVKMTGIPYCWGGFYSPYVGFGGKTFQDVIDKKYVAGNINSVGYYKYMTAGLDCSGFVCAAFGFTSKQSTSGLSDLGSKVDEVRKLQEMDILVYPGEHVIFFCEWLDASTLLVGESTVREGKVVIHPKSVNELVVNGNYQMRSPW